MTMEEWVVFAKANMGLKEDFIRDILKEIQAQQEEDFVEVIYINPVEKQVYNHTPREWLDENCVGKWFYLASGLWFFSDRNDAMRFKLVWGGIHCD